MQIILLYVWYFCKKQLTSSLPTHKLKGPLNFLFKLFALQPGIYGILTWVHGISWLPSRSDLEQLNTGLWCRNYSSAVHWREFVNHTAVEYNNHHLSSNSSTSVSLTITSCMGVSDKMLILPGSWSIYQQHLSVSNVHFYEITPISVGQFYMPYKAPFLKFFNSCAALICESWQLSIIKLWFNLSLHTNV